MIGIGPAALRCSCCEMVLGGRVIHYRDERTVPVSGDGYGWERVVTQSAAVFCSDECLRRWLFPEGSEP